MMIIYIYIYIFKHIQYIQLSHNEYIVTFKTYEHGNRYSCSDICFDNTYIYICSIMQ